MSGIISLTRRDEVEKQKQNKKETATPRYVNKSTPIAIDTEEAQKRNELRRL